MDRYEWAGVIFIAVIVVFFTWGITQEIIYNTCRRQAVEKGHGEFYINQDRGDVTFRWFPACRVDDESTP
ncbi:hypothetical protein LCGC14_2650590 [marine sediment metagenome]|uniref:Uncharacterized protein n=1 Tax=marine sediment metagenome TaxID=412755 RepID=A0A0F9C5A3_9ZZZZ